jgi:ribosomal protein S18 acetylase RimI-like enzyme
MSDSAEIIVKRLHYDDLDLLSHAVEDVFDNEIDIETAAAFLTDQSNVLLVAIVDGKLVAQLAAVILRRVDAHPELYIDNLGVAPPYQRRSIASQLLGAARDLGSRLGCGTTWALTGPTNEAACHLYGRTGARSETVSLFAYE